MKLKEIFEEQPIPVAINITSDNVAGIVKRAYHGIPERLWEFTTPRHELASFVMKDPSPEVLKQILDEINENITKVFLETMAKTAEKYKL